MGEVYRARDPRLGRDVALKSLPAAMASDPDRLARLEREAKLLAALSHPNIAAIYGIEEEAGARVLVLELAAGETLGERLQRGPMPIDDVVAVARQIVAALEAAHERGIVHRDLKPDLDVRGLQVAVDDSLLVRRLERLGDLLREGQRLVDGNGAAGNALRQILTLDQFHDQGKHAGRP